MLRLEHSCYRLNTSRYCLRTSVNTSPGQWSLGRWRIHGDEGAIASTDGLQNLLPDTIFGIKADQNQQRPGLCPGPHWGSSQRSPDPIASGRGWLPHPQESHPHFGPSGLKLRPFEPRRPPRPWPKPLDPPLVPYTTNRNTERPKPNSRFYRVGLLSVTDVRADLLAAALDAYIQSAVLSNFRRR